MKLIRQTYVIAAPADQVWQALTDPSIISQWSGAKADYPAETGAPYSLWDGTIRGEILELVPLERLVQTWKPEGWTTEDSVVRFTLVPEDDMTRVDLVHENVEESDYEGTDEGWDIYYLGAIKRMLESQQSALKVKQKAAPKKKSAARKTATTKKKSTAKKKPTAEATVKAKPKSKKKTAARKLRK